MNILIWIIGSTLFVSFLAFIGLLFFVLKEGLLKRIIMFLVALSAGTLMGGAFLHLIPEAVEGLSGVHPFICVLAGFVLFFFIEKVLHWRHCHKMDCKVHTFAYMNLLGDGVHNLIDGLIIAASFIASVPLGIATTIAVAFHEIPQELGDFGVLLHGGFSKRKALILNFIFALTAIIGGLVGYLIVSHVEIIVPYLLSFAAGGFIYVASSDLMPELRKEKSLKKGLLNFAVFLIGILIMYAFTLIG